MDVPADGDPLVEAWYLNLQIDALIIPTGARRSLMAGHRLGKHDTKQQTAAGRASGLPGTWRESS
jgi:hypothetical protein